MNEHKHAAVLRAIADGKPVQMLFFETNGVDVGDRWIDVPIQEDRVHLNSHTQYRVKPEPKKITVSIYKSGYNNQMRSVSTSSAEVLTRLGYKVLKTVEIEYEDD